MEGVAEVMRLLRGELGQHPRRDRLPALGGALCVANLLLSSPLSLFACTRRAGLLVDWSAEPLLGTRLLARYRSLARGRCLLNTFRRNFTDV